MEQLHFGSLCHRMAENTRGLLVTEKIQSKQCYQLLLSSVFQRQPLVQEDPTVLLDQNLRVRAPWLLLIYLYRHC